MTDYTLIFLFAVLAYLLGSIPFGLLLTRMAGLGDIRAIGSGNIGATNVLRTGNKKLAILTLLLDAGKGVVAAGLPHYYFGDTALPLYTGVAFVAAIVGHCFPIWLKFKGGKGVATYVGGLLSAEPVSALLFIILWPLTAFITRFSSLAALVAVAALVAFNLYRAETAIEPTHVPLYQAVVLVSLLIVWRHRDNIKRLLAGTESKIGRKKDDQPKDQPTNE
jgi:glycerol-3-phosphate acyltransferase PlsY